MATLLEDIKTNAAWIVACFKADGFKLDYTLESFRAIDVFFDQHTENGNAKPNGRFSENRGPILFSIGAYVGETIIKNVPGSVWITDDSDPKGELYVEIKLPNGTTIWPMQRVIKRFKEGGVNSIHPYGAVIIKEMAEGGYWEKVKQPQKKPWWKFW